MEELYKLRHKEKYVCFNHDTEFIDTWQQTVRTIYCKYDNAIELSEKAIDEWYEITNITWYSVLQQIKLDFEYEVEYTLLEKEYLNDLKEKQMLDRENILNWRKNSLIFNYNYETNSI